MNYFIFFKFFSSVILYLFKMPTTKEEWQIIANDFNRQWNFPFCIGSIDGKHIMLQAPNQTVS